MSLILHITTRDAWDDARSSGRYEAPSLASQGFIHLSTPEQVVRVANGLFAGQAGLILLCVDRRRVDAEIRDENCEGGTALFPHVYGPLNLDAVVEVVAFEPHADGRFHLPQGLPKPAEQSDAR
ncbi:MAG: DUF952 domain-containing protein [Planctomycetota bacterium]